MGKSPNIFVFKTPEQVALAAAGKFEAYAREAIADHGVFSVALAGGNTPRRVYELLAAELFRDRIGWAGVHLFFGDERAVPPDNHDSNYRMVHAALISQIGIPLSNVHRIIGEGDAHENAAAYERDLKEFFGEISWPRFDLILLGMGEDGHTASLFPGGDAVREELRWVAATRMEHLKQDRITITIPVINQAAHVMFLVTGKAKAKRLSEVIHQNSAAAPLPAQLVQPTHGTFEWLLDKEAASLL